MKPAVATAGGGLYQSAARIHPRTAHGRYARLRLAAMTVLLGLYYGLPWLAWNGRPVVLFDLPARRFHLFGLTLYPQDLYLLTGVLLLAALTLFLFTTLAGRLWCGYACPQTVWTEAFLLIERTLEGDRAQRMKRDAAPWTARKLAVRSAKHAAWVLFALATGLTFVSFFIPARELWGGLLHGQLSGWPLFWSAFYGFATWGNAGFLREQVCLYMCPYARFQSAMFDRDTLLIGYDTQRGEPRKGVARKMARGTAVGDCVDCNICVQVCPMGIDIRDGLQYQCIACAACVDACNEVMDKIGRPRGLIQYTSERREQEGRFRLLRGRAIGYGAVWAAVAAGFVALLLLRPAVGLDVIRDRKQLDRELEHDIVENVYVVKVTNKDGAAHPFTLSAALKKGGALDVEPARFELAAGEMRSVTVSARAPEDGLHEVNPVIFTLRADDQPKLAVEHGSTFISEHRKESHHDDPHET